MVSERDPVLRRHQEIVAESAGLVAEGLGLDQRTVDDVVLAAELHDLGKLALPQSIVHKPVALDDEEWRIMRRHTLIGESMLRPFPELHRVATFVRSSHERMDGRGYPDGLSGEAIPLPSRIVFVCDTWEAMTGGRAYRPPVSRSEALAELRRCVHSQFDPAVVEAFVAALRPRAL
jgi:HD-GYP domain-containing protein (c-di-GMP phosphodiesterase class II)